MRCRVCEAAPVAGEIRFGIFSIPCCVSCAANAQKALGFMQKLFGK